MNNNDQDLNTGEAHLDGEGEYTPQTGGPSLEETDDNTGSENTPGETVQGPDLEIGGNEEIDESDVELPTDGVEYSAPKPPGDDDEEQVVEKTPMDEIANGTNETVAEETNQSLEGAIAELEQIDIPVKNDEDGTIIKGSMPGKSEEKPITPEVCINMDNVIEEQRLTQSKKPGFDSQSVQDARNNQRQEGGIARNRTTGNQFNSGGKPEGAQVIPSEAPPDYSQMYEMTGFTVSFEKVKGQGNVNVEIRDHFLDIETSLASVNGDKYLMPMPQIGYKVVEIVSGAPTLSHQDRVLYEYINDKWRRK